MKHTVTITHEVEAASWDKAVEAALREPTAHVAACQVKSPGKRLLHVAPGNLQLAYAQLKEEDHAHVPGTGL